MRRPGARTFAALLTLALTSLGTVPATAQGRLELRIERGDGSFGGVAVELGRGYAAVPLTVLNDLGWTTGVDGRDVRVAVPGQIDIELTLDSPFFRWDGVALQLTDPPYRNGPEVLVPLQLLTDYFPRRLPDLYDFDGPNATLRAGDLGLAVGGASSGPAPVVTPPDQDASGGAETAEVGGAAGVSEPIEADGPPSDGPSTYDGPRLVVIDPGHGGEDPGAMSRDGTREKAIALGIGLRLAEALADEPGVEVRMIRDDDTFVEAWDRGQIATELKGDRPAVFVSIHANSFPARRSARGFETYFLSEARTEHERRVTAIENAPLSFRGQDVDREAEPDLDFILRELRNLDHQHWSELLAQYVQEELDDFHPGPNRGVKQGILAVLTNALMPSVLVEVGYLSNDAEARLMAEEAFQADAGEAIADAILRFFERYPPGSEFGGRKAP